MRLRFHRLRFRFLALDSLYFPPYKSGNIVRGAFGELFREATCLNSCPEPAQCPLAGACHYERVFAPIARASMGGLAIPSGFRDLPRPLVFRAAHLDGRTLAPGTPFHLDVHTFAGAASLGASLTTAFARLAHAGIGPRRGRARLVAAEALGLHGESIAVFWRGEAFLPLAFPPPLTLTLPETLPSLPSPQAASATAQLGIRFLTPTELKQDGHIIACPAAVVLVLRAFDRIESLLRFYPVPEEDPAGDPLGSPSFGVLPLRNRLRDAAATLRIVHSALRHQDVERTSTRTGQIHALGGFLGEICYEGPADAIRSVLPWLHAASFTGIGRQTVWGKGVLALDAPRGSSGALSSGDAAEDPAQ